MHCDLDLWPFDLKIYRAHPWLMESLHVKFHDDRCKGKAVMRRKPFSMRTTDGWTDRRTWWFQYTPPNFVAGGIITYCTFTNSVEVIKHHILEFQHFGVARIKRLPLAGWDLTRSEEYRFVQQVVIRIPLNFWVKSIKLFTSRWDRLLWHLYQNKHVHSENKSRDFLNTKCISLIGPQRYETLRRHNCLRSEEI